MREMAAECIKTIKLRMRAYLSGRARRLLGNTARSGKSVFVSGVVTMDVKRLQESRHARRRHSWAPGGGDVRHESDDICDVEASHAGQAKKGSRPDGATRTECGVEARHETARWIILLREFSRKARRSS